MTQYKSYALSLKLKRVAVAQAHSSQAVERAWKHAASTYDAFFMESQEWVKSGWEWVCLYDKLIETFTRCGVWQETARCIVDQCLFQAGSVEIA